MIELPKLSRSMRVNTSLETIRQLKNEKDDQIKLKVFRAKEAKKGVSWKDLKLFVNEKSPQDLASVIIKELQEIWGHCREMIGSEENSLLVDEAAIFMLRLFLDQKIVMLKHTSQVKKIFGQVPNHLINKMNAIVYKLSDQLNEECRKYLEESENEEVSATKSIWGSHIKCEIPSEYFNDTSLLQDFAPALPSDNKAIIDFSMKYDKKDNEKPTSSKQDSKYTRQWLGKQINPELIDNLVELLKSGKSNEELQNELFDFLGFDKFEFILEILQNRKVVIDKASKPVDKINVFKEKAVKKLANMQHAPNYLMPVMVQSESEKQLRKQVQKEEKKLKKFLNAVKIDEEEEDDELDPAKMRLNYQQSLLMAAQMKPLFGERPASTRPMPAAPKVVRYPHVYDSFAAAKSHVGFIAGNKIVLPENVERVDSKMYEEVKIPACDPPALSIGSNRVQVSELDEIGQMAFHGIKELNRIQSVVYPAAYHSNENLLICAPTGAGKTNVAMMAIISTIKQFYDQEVIQRDQFKIVYVAPMKALASEMTSSFGKRLLPLGLLVRELTGDMKLTKAEMQATQMIVTTPEKWDVVTRKGAGDVAFISLVKLLIIDEVHLLHGDRGPVVEALVARTLRLVESSQSMIRIVGLSATLPNYIDVARFLRVNPMVGLFFFDSRFRPVPLQTNFIGVKALKMLQQLSDMDTICYDKCIEMVKQGHQVMVFVHARNATGRTATVIREMAQQKGHIPLLTPESNPEYGNALKAMSKSRNKQLADLFQSGLAMHHAGMLRQDRNLVEKYFSDGIIKILV